MDNNAALYVSAPAAAVVEEVAGEWIKDILGLPARASFAFTTGCQMAHATCLAAARHALLGERGWNVERDGLFDAPRIRVLANENRHGSLTRALRFLGFGSNCVEPLATDADSRVEPATLMAAIQQNSAAPTIGTQCRGSERRRVRSVWRIDSTRQSERRGSCGRCVWAVGAGERAGACWRTELKGPTPWATDAHKWLNTPQDIGIAIVADPEAHKAVMDISAAYLSADGQARDPLDWTP